MQLRFRLRLAFSSLDSLPCKRAFIAKKKHHKPFPALLPGDHTAAAQSSERAHTIAAKHRRHGDAVNHLLPPTEVGKTAHLSDPLPRLEWVGVQRFVAGDISSARDFFARARELVLLRSQEQGSSNSKGGACDARVDGFSLDDTADDKASGAALAEGLGNPGKVTTGEFDPDAMRLDRCVAVSICRQGPEAF